MYNKYLELFGVTETDLQRLINIALEEGGDYADLYFEHSISNELALRDGEVNAAGSHIDYGVGIRVLSGDQTGYAYSEITTMPQMEKAARTAARIATSASGSYIPPQNVTLLQGNNRYPIIKGWEQTTVTDKIPYLNRLNTLVFDADSRVVKVMARISDSITKILFYNSLGETYADLRPMVSVTCNCVMQDGGKIESGGTSRSFRSGFEMIDDRLIDTIAEEVISKTAFLFGAKQPKGGEMQVVMGSGSSGILLHEAVGHAFEADFNRKGTSIFSDMMGKQVCHNSINIIDDGTIKGNRGAVNYDDEGVPGQKTYLVKDGILNSYLHDRISASYYNTAPTGNGRRESFRYMPLPRMRATYMESGNVPEEELIASVKNGIYADNFSNGQVQIGAGDFTFFVKSGYLIENGKLTQPIKDININGNGPQALKDIIAVADNNTIDNSTWTCGKEQYCPVSCGMPSVLVNKLTVGGSN
ncbi:MAG: TldD/PmbA family protein [Bacteroidales bacterium]|nr:TldD/PmbA family protein [Bacteroidales bacterium]